MQVIDESLNGFTKVKTRKDIEDRLDALEMGVDMGVIKPRTALAVACMLGAKITDVMNIS